MAFSDELTGLMKKGHLIHDEIEGVKKEIESLLVTNIMTSTEAHVLWAFMHRYPDTFQDELILLRASFYNDALEINNPWKRFFVRIKRTGQSVIYQLNKKEKS